MQCVEDSLDATHLLDELGAHAQEKTSDGFGAALVARLAGKEFRPWYCILTLELTGEDDFFVLSENEGIIFGLVL